VCILLQQGLAHGRILCLALFFDCVKVAGSVISLSFIFYLPFYRSFISPSKGIGIVTFSNHSPLSSELLIYGLFIFIFLSLLIESVLKPLRSDTVPFAATLRPALPHKRITDNKLPLTALLESGVHISKRSDEYDDGVKKVASAQICVAEKVEPLLTINSIGKQLHVFSTEFGICFFLLGCLVILVYLPAYTTCIAALSLALIGFVLMFYHIRNRAQAFTLLLGVIAFTLIAGCEIFFLKDIFADGDAQRMNTIFKIYFQAWALLSICSGAGLFFIFEGFRSLKPSSRIACWLVRSLIGLWGCGLLVLVSASMVFPLLSPATRYERIDGTPTQPYLMNTSTLDGMAYLASCHEPDCDYDTSSDYSAIHWLNEHIQGAPVLVEANGDDYHYNGRVSVFTGLPTIINWAGHELQWRVNWINDKRHPSHEQDFSNRGIDVNTIYTDAQSARVLKTMARYHAQYVYVGALEHKKYPSVNLERFGSFMRIVYHQGDVTIYQVK
jgi:YYY domain-containing protein